MSSGVITSYDRAKGHESQHRAFLLRYNEAGVREVVELSWNLEMRYIEKRSEVRRKWIQEKYLDLAGWPRLLWPA